MNDGFFCVFTERYGVPSLFDCIKPPCHVASSGEGFLAAWSKGSCGASVEAEQANQAEPPEKTPSPEKAL